MSKIWLVMIISSLIMLAVFSPASVVSTMMEATKMGITMCIEFIGIYAVWMGIMQVMDDCRLSHKLSKILSKPVQYIFGRTDEETNKNICNARNGQGGQACNQRYDNVGSNKFNRNSTFANNFYRDACFGGKFKPKLYTLANHCFYFYTNYFRRATCSIFL